MTKEDQLQQLHELISVARDSELGYQTAAEHVDDIHLVGIFDEYAKQRAGFVEALTKEAARITGDVPSECGTVKGAVFRGWMNLKSAVTGGSAEAIVAACETGEDAAQAAYERVADTPVTGRIRSLVDAQLAGIKEAHQRMLHLKAGLAGRTA